MKADIHKANLSTECLKIMADIKPTKRTELTDEQRSILLCTWGWGSRMQIARQLKIGYNALARIAGEMEENGLHFLTRDEYLDFIR